MSTGMTNFEKIKKDEPITDQTETKHSTTRSTKC